MKILKRAVWITFALFCASMGRIIANYYAPTNTSIYSYSHYLNYKAEMDSILSKKGKISGSETVNIDGEMVPCTFVIHDDYTGKVVCIFKSGPIEIPMTVDIIGSNITYHYNYQGRKWDYTTTFEKLIAMDKGDLKMD